MNPFENLVVRGGPVAVEIDPTSCSAYIRFKSAKVAKTLADSRVGGMAAVDLDSRGEVIGIELVHVKEFSICCIRAQLPANFREVNMDKARFVVPDLTRKPRQSVPVHA